MKKDRKELLKIGFGSLFLLLGIILPKVFALPDFVEFSLSLVALLTAGYDVYLSAVKNILKGDFLDEKFLMAIASVGAFVIGEYSEGVAVMLFFSVGEFFERKAVGKSRKSIKALMQIRPDTARVIREGEEVTVDAEEVMIGEILVLAAGERIPVDCVVIEGKGDIDTSSVTGESLPMSAYEDTELSGGCVNMNSQLKAKAIRTAEDSAASRILSLVEEATDKKSKQENFITAFSRYYTPIVVFSAIALAIIPPFFDGMAFTKWIYRALMFLVVSCPCALVISVPLSFFGGIGAAASRGILYKGGYSFDAMKNVSTVIFDKTGTLTTGKFNIDDIVTVANITKDELLEIAARAEHNSSHPMALALKTAYGKKTVIPDSSNEIAGEGIISVFGEEKILVGNKKLLVSHGIEVETDSDDSSIYVAKNGKYLGYITLIDEVKPEARNAVKELRALGVRNTVMLTGDKSSTAELVSLDVGIDDCHASLMPEDKYRLLELWLRATDGRVIYVGDGINDAPVIARADVGVAMGNVGSDAAIEASDLVIMSGNLKKLPEAIKIARRTLRIAKENIILAIGIKLLVLILCAVGLIGMWWAVFADVGVAVLAILNAMRTLRFNK